MKKPVSVIIVGAGGRGFAYANLARKNPKLCKIVGVAEPRDFHREKMVAEHNIAPEMTFHLWQELAKQPKLADAVAICTQDAMHEDCMLAFAKLGYHILLEKPMAPTAAACRRIVAAAKKNGKMFAVCHVMRYTNYTQCLKRMIDKGAVGDIVSVEHLEPVGFWHQAHSFVRGNWRNEKESSFMLLAKACHDVDWLSFIVGRPWKHVSSFGSLSHFKASEAPEGATERCTEACPHYHTCPYSVDKNYLEWGRRGVFTWPIDVVSQVPTMEALEEALRTGPYGRCVYHCDNDVVDHQVVNILFEDGVTANFSMCPFTAEGGRKIVVMGTKGDLNGFLDQDKIVFSPFIDRFSDHSVTYPTEDVEDNFGHGGGDYAIIRDLLALLTGKHDVGSSLTRVSDSIESHVIALAAEESRAAGGKLVRSEEFIRENRK